MSTPEKETREYVVERDAGGNRGFRCPGYWGLGLRLEGSNYPLGTRVAITITPPPAPALPSGGDLDLVERTDSAGKRVVAAYRTLREKARAVVEHFFNDGGGGFTKTMEALRAALGEGRE